MMRTGPNFLWPLTPHTCSHLLIGFTTMREQLQKHLQMALSMTLAMVLAKACKTEIFFTTHQLYPMPVYLFFCPAYWLFLLHDYPVSAILPHCLLGSLPSELLLLNGSLVSYIYLLYAGGPHLNGQQHRTHLVGAMSLSMLLCSHWNSYATSLAALCMSTSMPLPFIVVFVL